MTELQDNSDAIPAALPSEDPVSGDVFDREVLLSILSIVTASANQTQWMCDQIQQFYQSMPGFMRKGLVPDGNH